MLFRSGLLTKLMFDIPSDTTVEKVIITAACVNGEEQPRIGRKQELLEGEAASPAEESAS